ncbi:uncharacterized protein LOC135149542 [Daucus carota subsp. sativus]|uniref:uncharacterized protein LOC135149542 n=1 Tax=Daucus carota subsp. sativus TaxID=79200 RepID=UPI003083CB68
MSTTAFEFDGSKFMTNNYAAILDNSEAPSEFHLIQDFLAHSELMYALTQPESFSPSQVLTFWRTSRYDDGGDHGLPSLTCEYEGQEYFVSPATVRKALHLPNHNKFHSSVSTQTLRDMMIFFGYSGNTDKMGELKRPHLCKEWSFFYDCITRAFANKCSNFDAIPLFSQQIGYSLIHNLKFDLATSILRFIGDRRTENMNIVYYARFCQLIFSYCFPTVPIPEAGNELPFKITKRAFTDLIKKDSKKPQVPVFAIPVTVQDNLKLVMPDKYDPIFSDENIPSSSHQPQDVSSSGPSQKGPVVKTDHQPSSGPSSSPTRVLRSSKSPSKSSPPPRKRRFLQKISNSDSDHETIPTPLVSRPRKKVKPTSITDLTVDPPLQSAVNPLEMITVSDPVMVEPLSTVPLTTSSPEADIHMSEPIPETLVQSEGTLPPTTPPTAMPLSEEAPEQPAPEIPEFDQEPLIPDETHVAAPVQEISDKTISEAATAPLCSHTVSIIAADDDDDTEINSVPNADLASLIADISAQLRETTSDREISPVRISSPIKIPSPAPSSSIPQSISAQNKVCTLTYSRKMDRAPSSSVEDRLSSIEATQSLMQHTLADLSSSVAQLVKFLTSADVKKGEKVPQDKCKMDQQQKSDDEEKDEEKKRDGNTKSNSVKSNSEIVLHTQAEENRREKVGSSSKQTQTTQSESQPLILADNESRALSEQLIEIGDPESKILSHTVKIQGKETTLFYKAPTQLDFDEAVAKNLFEEENPGVSIEDIRKEEERLAAEKKKISKAKSDEKKQITDSSKKLPSSRRKGIVISEVNYADINKPRVYQKKSDSDSSGKGKNVIDGVPSKKKDESEATQTLATISEFTDQNLASDTAQAENLKEIQLNPAEVKTTWIKTTSDKAQADTAESKKKSLFGSLGTGQYKESSLFTQIRDKGTRGKEARDTTGLGHKKEKIQTSAATIFKDPYPLTEKTGEVVTQKDLDKIESVQILMDTHDGPEDKEKIALFLESGRNEATKRWYELLKRTIQEKRRFYGISSDAEYVPKITQEDGSEINMEKNSSVMETIAGTRILGYNNEADRPGAIQLGEAMKRCKARALRSAIYQTGEDNEELKTVKAQMIQTLRQIEEDLITQFVKESYGYRLIG